MWRRGVFNDGDINQPNEALWLCHPQIRVSATKISSVTFLVQNFPNLAGIAHFLHSHSFPLPNLSSCPKSAPSPGIPASKAPRQSGADPTVLCPASSRRHWLPHYSLLRQQDNPWASTDLHSSPGCPLSCREALHKLGPPASSFPVPFTCRHPPHHSTCKMPKLEVSPAQESLRVLQPRRLPPLLRSAAEQSTEQSTALLLRVSQMDRESRVSAP